MTILRALLGALLRMMSRLMDHRPTKRLVLEGWGTQPVTLCREGHKSAIKPIAMFAVKFSVSR